MGRSQAPLCCGCCQMVGGRQGARPCLQILCFPVVLLQVAFRQIISCSQVNCVQTALGVQTVDLPGLPLLLHFLPLPLPGMDHVTQGLVYPCCRAWFHIVPALDRAAIAPSGWHSLLPNFLSSRHKLLFQPFLVMTKDFEMCRLFTGVLFSFTSSVSSLVSDSSSKFCT